MRNLFYIFKWNFKRFFSKADTEEGWYAENAPNGSSFCANAITAVVRENGRAWLLPVNITLFLLGLIFAVTDDWVQFHSLSFGVHVICFAAACAYLILKFDAWKVNDNGNILKLMYIFGMTVTGGYVSLIYVFLVIYENIVAYGSWGGI